MSAPPLATHHLVKLLTPYRRPIAFALSLGAVEQVAWIVEPFVFGRAIDAFVEHHYHGSLSALLASLAAWIAVFLLNSSAGVVRQIYAERVNTSLYRDVCVSLVRTGAQQHEPVSQTASRAELFRELVSFLDERAPALVASILNLAGSAIALSLFDYRMAIACSVIAAPIAFAQRIVTRHVGLLQREEHDLRERNVDVFGTGDPDVVLQHFHQVGRVRVRVARWRGLNFGVLRAFMLAIFVVVLFIAIDMDRFSIGSVYSIVSYLWTFVTYAEDAPMLLEARSSLADLARRVQEQPPVVPTPASP